MSKQFWLVWNERGHSPTFKHDSLTSARNEAERLSRNNPGQEFHVLGLYGTCAKNDVIWSVVDQMDSELPF